MNWQKTLSRLSIPGLVLLVLGAVACTQANRLQERFVLPVRIAGLAAVLAGAAILLDLIPGL